MTGDRSREADQSASTAVVPDVAVLRRTAAGWSVGDEDVPDLTCAMVLADLIAAELPGSAAEPSGSPAKASGIAADGGGVAGHGAAGSEAAGDGATGDGAAGDEGGHDEARRLRVTIGQLERALAVRIRVEQAIGVLAERHRIRPRQAFEQLRSVARGRGQRVIDIAGEVIASATNPLLPLPEELCRPSIAPRPRSRSPRRARDAQ
jgi:ANTAR domain